LKKAKTTVVTVATPATPTTGTACKSHHPSEAIGTTRIKVTVHIPDNVPRRQEKINRIYDILNPAPSDEAV